ncbi:MAG: cupin domain-containing protein [Lachnospiraceae bacterium]|nr:cupin domain-containing protein [Lachnospiraceae bacterium]MDE6600845.1 cupin domain-containing protein [Lachnospiraceae bacterium]MDE7357992.1 cupin domain-containing protein [Lachnospiraceae bacterium]
MGNDLFETFDSGSLRLPEATAEFADIPWTEHPAFDGVALKHIVSAKDTAGQFSYHLVRIAPGKSIRNHIHETQLETHEVIAGSGVCINDGAAIPYEPGVISLMPAGIPHEVNAGADGLFLFAKFMPALC